MMLPNYTYIYSTIIHAMPMHTTKHPYPQFSPLSRSNVNIFQMANQRIVTTAVAAPCAWCKACLLVARAAFSTLLLGFPLHKMSSNISDKTSPCTNWLLLVFSSLTSGSNGSSTLANIRQQ